MVERFIAAVGYQNVKDNCVFIRETKRFRQLYFVIPAITDERFVAQVAILNARETITVEAPDEFKAQTRAMLKVNMPLRGEHVTYETAEV